MKRLYALVLGTLCLIAASPSEAGFSAARRPEEGFEEALRRVYGNRANEVLRDESVHGMAGSFADLDFSRVPRMADLVPSFHRFRDERSYRAEGDPSFPRRISWLYPYDGCYTRAAAVGRLAHELKIPRPANLFAFGSLRVTTANAKGGTVEWWYHVAPIARDAKGEAYVLDAALSPERPLTPAQWVGRMSGLVPYTQMKFAICAPAAFQPSDDCERPVPGDQDSLIVEMERIFLPEEWKNLRALGRAPEKELGDSPPWWRP